jgi:hypothetical protein
VAIGSPPKLGPDDMDADSVRGAHVHTRVPTLRTSRISRVDAAMRRKSRTKRPQRSAHGGPYFRAHRRAKSLASRAKNSHGKCRLRLARDPITTLARHVSAAHGSALRTSRNARVDAAMSRNPAPNGRGGPRTVAHVFGLVAAPNRSLDVPKIAMGSAVCDLRATQLRRLRGTSLQRTGRRCGRVAMRASKPRWAAFPR